MASLKIEEKTQNRMMVIVRALGAFVAIAFGRFLGAEVATAKNLVLLPILILGVIFLFRLSCLRKNKEAQPRFLLVFLYIFIFFGISLFFYFMKIYLVYRLGLFFNLTAFVVGCCVVSGAGQSLPSGPSSSSLWTEDSFEIQVLLEPFSETEMEGTSSANRPIPNEAGPAQPRAFSPNQSFESSLRNRIVRLENNSSLFLLGKTPGQYWAEIKEALDQAPSHREYNRLLDFENRDLQIRELKHDCYVLFQQVLSEHPALAENAPYNPGEAFIDFFDEKRAELDTWSTAEKEGDRGELLLLRRVRQDLRERGPDSIYMIEILSGRI